MIKILTPVAALFASFFLLYLVFYVADKIATKSTYGEVIDISREDMKVILSNARRNTFNNDILSLPNWTFISECNETFFMDFKTKRYYINNVGRIPTKYNDLIEEKYKKLTIDEKIEEIKNS